MLISIHTPSGRKAGAHYTQAADFYCLPVICEQKKCPQKRAFSYAILNYFLACRIQSFATRAKLDLSDTDWKALIASAFLPRFKLATPKRT